MYGFRRRTTLSTQELISLVKETLENRCFYLNELVVEAMKGDRNAERFLVEVLKSSTSQSELFPTLGGLSLLLDPENETVLSIDNFRKTCKDPEFLEIVDQKNGWFRQKIAN